MTSFYGQTHTLNDAETIGDGHHMLRLSLLFDFYLPLLDKLPRQSSQRIPPRMIDGPPRIAHRGNVPRNGEHVSRFSTHPSHLLALEPEQSPNTLS